MIIDVCLVNITQLKINRDATAGREDVDALDCRKVDLQGFVDPLNTLAMNSKLLCSYGVPFCSLSSVSSVDKLIKTLTQCAKDLTETPNESILKKGNRWSKLLDSLKILSTNVEASQKTDWGNFCKENFFKGLSPDRLLHKLNQSEENRIKFEHYKSLYSKFVSLKSKIPEGEYEFKQLQEISDKLGKIELIEEVLPPSVKVFLSAVEMGAGLDTVTPEIIDYLRKNHLLSGYVVNKRPY